MQQPHALTRQLLALLAVLVFPAASPVFGGLVAPGQSGSLNSFDFAGPTGTLLDQRTSSFSVPYGSAQPLVGFGGQLSGTLHSAVYREASGALSFLYDIDLDNAPGVNAAEGSRLDVRSFASFTTTISGSLDFEQLIAVSRTANGSHVSVFSDSPGLGGAPVLLVRTNATSFDKAGSATYSAADEVSLLDGSSRAVSGSAMIDNVIEPTANIGPVGPPVSIPLPPAFYSGLGVLLATGLITWTRRGWMRG